MVVDRHNLTVFYPNSFDMDLVQVGEAVYEIYTTIGIILYGTMQYNAIPCNIM